MSTETSWGFNVKELDPKVRPQDDFYGYVNNVWKRKNPIPKNEARWGTFMKLRYDTEHILHGILQELDGMKNVPDKSPEQMARDLYRSGMDMDRRNGLGLAPLSPLLSRIAGMTTQDDLTDMIAVLHKMGVDVPWGVGIDQDARRSDRYLLHVYQSGLGMPERDYYLKSDAESVRVREAYRTHVYKMFVAMGHASAKARVLRDTVLSLETALAKASMRKEDLRDPEKTYHRYTRSSLMAHTPSIDWKRYLTGIKAERISTIIVRQPAFLKHVNHLYSTVPLADWKTYLSWQVVNQFAGALSTPFVRQSFSFYGTVLSGTKQMKPLWRQVLSAVNGTLGEVLGQVYVKRHFSPQAKREMNRIVTNLFTAYEARITSLDWMTAPTKRKALQKLRALNRKIGYPDTWKSYRGLVIRPDDFVGNLIRAHEYEHARDMKKLAGPIDRGEWFMHPQTVNAYFAPTMNDIVFPAAILQPPFFDPTADDAVNYGSIGAVIGHEITHGFDDEGSKYDARGNLKSWWSTEDRKRFEKKAKVVKRQYNQFVVADGVPVNGKLTLGENIADFGGLSIAYDAYQLQLARTGRTIIDGLTPEQRFFISFAVFERENTRPEFQKMQVLTDPHSPGIFRINGPVSNFTPFYDAFGVDKGDALYRAPKDREMVW